MIKGRNLRQLWKEAGSGRAFRYKLRDMFGYSEDPKTERKTVDHSKAQIGIDEFSIRDLAEEFLGREFLMDLHQGPPSESQVTSLLKAKQEVALFEDAVPLTPSVFQDINAFNASVSGLVEIRMLEAYNRPEFIGDEFCEVQPTRVNGGKIIGVSYVGNVAQVTPPGIEFPNVGVSEMYAWARPNLVVGLKLSLDRSALVYDLSGELMASAETVGSSLGYRSEYLIAGGVQGLNNVTDQNGNSYPEIADSFIMNASNSSTPNPTYQTAAVTTNGNFYSFINSQTQTFADWTSLQASQTLLNLMRDPINKLPFMTRIRKVLVDPSSWHLALQVKHQTQAWLATGTPATAPYQGAASTFPPVGNQNPGLRLPSGELDDWTPHMSNIWHQALLDGGVTEANCKLRWYAGDPKKAFIWRSAWDLRTDQANPSSADMLGRNIINMWVSQWSGQFAVREPRYVIRNTN